MDYSNLKLVIWDLDDTFWRGTLSEGHIEPIYSNIQLIRTLTDCGIVNTICSKNDAQPVMDKLNELEVAEFFVFSSVNWEAKGKRIQELLKNIGLRAENCLFLDDNPSNLNEAKYYEPSLNIEKPAIIHELISYFSLQQKKDLEHNRLKQYKVLEQKQNAKAHASDNLEFLYHSNTQVEIFKDCINEINRIYELVNRTNQLNFTKIRSTKEELERLFKDPSIDAGYIKVKDNFGEYGIVGFYAIKNRRLLHFLFSCRTIGQGVEQWVYAKLGYPKLDIEGSVVSNVTRDEAPRWINQGKERKANIEKSTVKVIFKGGCDLMNMTSYLGTENVIEEFTYIGEKKKNTIEHHYHSTNILSFPFLNNKERESYVKDYIFNDEKMFETRMFDDDISIIFLGTMIEPNLGVYKNKQSGRRIAFCEYSHPLTDKNEWDAYIQGTIFNGDNTFTPEWLEWFSNSHQFLGALSPTEILDEYKQILSRVGKNTRLCFLLGSEQPFEKESNPNYFGREKIYKQINELIKDWAKTEERVLYIEFNKYIHGQDDFTNNINHFQRRVYYQAALQANKYIRQLTGQKLREKNKIFLYIKQWGDNLGSTGFYQTKLWRYLRIPYVWIRERG